MRLFFVGIVAVVIAASCSPAVQTEDSDGLGSYLVDIRGYSAVPLVRLPTGHFALRGRAGEEDLDLIVDTGASHTVIDIARAERFGLDSEDRGGRATGVGSGSQSVETGRLHEVRIGPIELGSLRVTVMDLSSVNRVLERMGNAGVDGIVGADVLMDQKAVIDYGSLMLYFRD